MAPSGWSSTTRPATKTWPRLITSSSGRNGAAPVWVTPLVNTVGRRTRRPRLRAYVPVGHSGGHGNGQGSSGPHRASSSGRTGYRSLTLTGRCSKAGSIKPEDRAHGYSLICFDGPCPDELLEAVRRAHAGHEHCPAQPPVMKMCCPHRPRSGPTTRRSSAGWAGCGPPAPATNATDQLVGFTQLLATPTRPWLGQQWDTGVDPAHRNLGLGRWLKAANALPPPR